LEPLVKSCSHESSPKQYRTVFFPNEILFAVTKLRVAMEQICSFFGLF